MARNKEVKPLPKLDHEKDYRCKVVNNSYPLLNRQYAVGDELVLTGLHAAAFSRDGYVKVLGLV